MHILTLVILGAQVMVVIQACQISDGGTPYVLQTCQYVTLNKKIPLLYNIAFSNIYSHFIAFSKLSMNYQLNDINISYLIRVLSHCCCSFGCLDI